MPRFLALSFEGDLAPSFDLHCLRPGRRAPDGWGIAYYPGGGNSASVLKEPAPPAGSMRSELIRAWEHLESSLFLMHIRVATWGTVNDANTQPFLRSWGARDWCFAHAGSLTQRPVPRPGARFEAVGSTDSEQLFCELLERIADAGWRSLGDADPVQLRAWYGELNAQGTLTSCLSDGRDLVVYADGVTGDDVYVWDVVPPYPSLAIGDEDLHVDLAKRGVPSRRGVVVSSAPLQAAGEAARPWRQIAPGTLLIIREGVIRAEVDASGMPPIAVPVKPAHATPTAPQRVVEFGPRARPHPMAVAPRTLSVHHRTVYRYDTAVERSTHQLRLTPVHDPLQRIRAHAVTIHVDGTPLHTPHRAAFEDVFGNRVERVLIDRPYRELIIDATSTVEVLDTDPLAYRPLRQPSSLPLAWMPWQRQVLQPYLLPPELPESELEELMAYAMRFVRRNDSDLLETLLDLNQAIYGEYAYQPGTTTLNTTPFEVYTRRRGVCQDFANLFICLARLLGVPARYVCGYLYTGPAHANTRQAEASHAWLQVYLPEVGWRGFDPTNGVLTQTDHVRVAVGRTYVDATPTSGTIYVGGGGETLEVAVSCEPITADAD
jgi:transglutaminase-like putative cysteine protease/predicted glutamine amidotransferase